MVRHSPLLARSSARELVGLNQCQIAGSSIYLVSLNVFCVTDTHTMLMKLTLGLRDSAFIGGIKVDPCDLQ